MKEFEKWKEEFYKKHRGVNRYQPGAREGWRGALKEVLKQVDISNSDGSIVVWIKKELEE